MRPACVLLAGADLRARAHAISPPPSCDRVQADQHTGFVSRSYRAPFALVAWHRWEVGVDIERVERPAEGFGASIATPSELRVVGPEALEIPSLVACLWSGKEALAKALGDARDYDPRRLESPLLWPDGVCGCWRAERLDAPVGHVAWICWRAS